MRARNTIEFTHIALGLVDPEMMKVGHIQYVAPTPVIGIDDTVRDNLSLDDWHQGNGCSIWNDLGVNFNKPNTGFYTLTIGDAGA